MLLRILVFSSKKQVIKQFFSQVTLRALLSSRVIVILVVLILNAAHFSWKCVFSSNCSLNCIQTVKIFNWNEINLDQQKCVNINSHKSFQHLTHKQIKYGHFKIVSGISGEDMYKDWRKVKASTSGMFPKSQITTGWLNFKLHRMTIMATSSPLHNVPFNRGKRNRILWIQTEHYNSPPRPSNLSGRYSASK